MTLTDLRRLHLDLHSIVAGRRHLSSADTMKLSVTRTVVGARAFVHLEQSTSRAQTDVVQLDILAEAENLFIYLFIVCQKSQ